MSDDIGEAALAFIRQRARSGVTTGRDRHPIEAGYLDRCTHLHYRTGTLVMFTRDTGHHSSGWLKNPDYERCIHLSLSFREPFPTQPVELLGSPSGIRRLTKSLPPRPFDERLADQWTRLLLRDARRLSWREGAFSAQGRALTVTHWRVFCDPAWQPIKPRGEVYSRELTEAGWRSWSEVQGQDAPRNWVEAE